VCNSRKYDERAISWLTMLLSPNAGRSTQAGAAKPPVASKPGGIRPTQEQERDQAL